jgi:hypothetical protein
LHERFCHERFIKSFQLIMKKTGRRLGIFWAAQGSLRETSTSFTIFSDLKSYLVPKEKTHDRI